MAVGLETLYDVVRIQLKRRHLTKNLGLNWNFIDTDDDSLSDWWELVLSHPRVLPNITNGQSLVLVVVQNPRNKVLGFLRNRPMESI